MIFQKKRKHELQEKNSALFGEGNETHTSIPTQEHNNSNI